MAVSKSAIGNYQVKRIGRLRNLSEYEVVILSNDTIKELNERWLFSLGSIDYHFYYKYIRLGREANLHTRIFTNGTAVAGVNVTGAAIRLTVPVASKE